MLDLFWLLAGEEDKDERGVHGPLPPTPCVLCGVFYMLKPPAPILQYGGLNKSQINLGI